MRHRVKTKKLNRNKDQRKALVFALYKSIIENSKIRTTIQKAKYIKPKIEKLITRGKVNNLANRRILSKKLRNKKELVDKIVEQISPTFIDRQGGYLRIQKQETKRPGDKSSMAILSWVQDIKLSKEEAKQEKESRKATKDLKGKPVTKDKKEDTKIKAKK